MKSRVNTNFRTDRIVLGFAISGVLALLLGLASSGAAQPTKHKLPSALALTSEQAEILSHMSIEYLEDGKGGQVKTIRFTGVNVQIVNGLDSTESINGVGNLIVGYQELGNEREPDDRTGSHYVVVGRRHNYSQFGGIVAGESNISAAKYGCASAGRRNKADGQWSATLGGGFNRAGSDQAVVVGGDFNFAGSSSAVIVGGSGNHAVPPGPGSSATKAVVVGGFDNRSMGQGSVIVGGRYNETSANYSGILAGTNNTCLGDSQGGGSFSAIVGGESNSTGLGDAATVGGGLNRGVSGSHDWSAGSLFEDN